MFRISLSPSVQQPGNEAIHRDLIKHAQTHSVSLSFLEFGKLTLAFKSHLCSIKLFSCVESKYVYAANAGHGL